MLWWNRSPYIIKISWRSTDITDLNDTHNCRTCRSFTAYRFQRFSSGRHAGLTSDWLFVRLIDRAESDEAKLSRTPRVQFLTLIEKKRSHPDKKRCYTEGNEIVSLYDARHGKFLIELEEIITSGRNILLLIQYILFWASLYVYWVYGLDGDLDDEFRASLLKVERFLLWASEAQKSANCCKTFPSD